MDRRTFLKAIAALIVSKAAIPERAFALENSDLCVFSPSLAREYASAFAEAMGNSADLVPGDPIPLFSPTNEMLGYEVDFSANGKPHGYVIFDVTCPSLVARFTLKEGADGLYSECLKATPVHPLIIDNAAPRLIQYNGLEYGSQPNEGDVVFLNSGNTVSRPITTGRSKPTTDWKSLMVGLYESGFTKQDACYGPYVGGVKESVFESQVGRYACAVSALYNIACTLPCPSWPAFDHFLIQGEDYSEYKTIWDYTSTSVDHTAGNITYGSTKYSNIGAGFVRYCASKGRTINSSENYSPSYDQFKNQALAGRYSVFTATIRSASNTSGETYIGHSMAAWGVASLAPTGTSSFEKYVLVFDGWNQDVYIRMNDPGYINQFGTFFTD